jgi:MFS family permease
MRPSVCPGVTAPGYAIAALAPFAGFFADRFGRRPVLLGCTFLCHGGRGAVFQESLDGIFASRILLGVCEAGILTVVNTLIADYWQDSGRRNWLMLQGLIGPFFQSVVFIAVAQVAAWRWNGGFLVYLAAVPIFISMCFTIFEPGRADTPAMAPPAMLPDAAPEALSAGRGGGGGGSRCSPLCSITCSS